MLVTVAAASVVAYALASAISNPIRILRKSFGEIKRGNWSYRIGQAGKDEFGELFQSFDQMAEALQKNNENVTDMDGRQKTSSERLSRETRIAPR
jgi:serine/threonine-protein kinase